MEIHSLRNYLRLVWAAGLFVPNQFRGEWRREWEAEIINRWRLLEEWEQLNAQAKRDLFKRVRGAFLDVLSFQQRRTSLVLVALNMLVALFTGFGALQAFIVDVIRHQQMQPFLISVAGIIVSVLFITSGIALLRRWPTVRRLITITGVLSILLHVYGGLPPHRIMGFPVLILGAGYGLVMLVVFEWNRKRNLVP